MTMLHVVQREIVRLLPARLEVTAWSGSTAVRDGDRFESLIARRFPERRRIRCR